MPAAQSQAAAQAATASAESVTLPPTETRTPAVVQNNAQTSSVAEASGLSKGTIGAIAALLGAIVLLGLFLWKQPQNQQTTKQSGVAQPQARSPMV